MFNISRRNMKNIEELALGTADVTAITPKVISATIEEVARGKRVFAQLFKENRDLIGKQGRALNFPKKGTGISASFDVGENTSLSASSFAYDAVTIPVKKVGIRLEFANEALESALRDVIKDHIYEAGIVFAETIDERALSQMLNLQSTIATLVTKSSYAASTWTPVWKITSVASGGTAGTLSGVNYNGGTFYFTGSVAAANATTVTFQYPKRIHDNTMYVAAKTPKTLSAWDMLTARAKMVAQHYVPTAVVIHDDDIPGLLYDEKLKFLDQSAYGGREAILNAEIGKIFGMKVITTAITYMASGAAVYVDTGDLGYNVLKRPLKGYREDKPEFDAVWYHMWGEQDFGVVNNTAVAISVNHGPTSGSLQACTSNPSA